MTAVRRTLRNALPVVVVLTVLLAAMYPVALLFGLPLARQRMENLNNWVRATVNARPVADLGDTGPLEFGSGDPGGAVDASAEVLATDNVVLVRGETPLDVEFALEGASVTLSEPLEEPLVTWGEELLPAGSAAPAAATSGGAPAGLVFSLPDPGALPPAIYRGDSLLQRGSVDAVERADGVRVRFTVPGASRLVDAAPEDEAGSSRPPAVTLVGDAVLLEGTGFEIDGNELVFASAPTFNTPIRLITGDYQYADVASGTVVLATPSEEPPRAAVEVVALAEALVGDVDGSNRRFTLQHTPLVESDSARRIFLDESELSGEAERPEERVDGIRDTFTFAGGQGIVTVDGVEQVEGVDFARDGNQVRFTTAPVRNAALRQYRDYLVSDPASGTVTLAVAASAGERLWAASYSYYDRPNCGETTLACFFSMPQHPVPFPNWIAERLVPFFTTYPLSDSRNVVRAVLYTAAGTL
ncbi:MAG TPA: hypothetical protein VFD39_11675, partial [Trueperaceae bacterium]|nr:hypothetical protein [Trueperaceae bacterium]